MQRATDSTSGALDEDLTPAEVVCHTLLLDSGSRRVSYSMLLIEAEDLDQKALVETAQWYAWNLLWTRCIGHFRATSTGQMIPPVILLKKDEYMALKEQYGVS